MFKDLTSLTWPFLGFLIGLLAWQSVTVSGYVPEFLLASPLSILAELLSRPEFYLGHLLSTATTAMIGYILSIAIGVGLAALFTWSSVAEKGLYLYVLTLKITPAIALTPLLVLWLGIGLASKVAIVILICFFPIFVGALKGFKSVNIGTLDLFRSLRANTWQTLLYLRLPSSLPFIFPALKVSLLLSFTGALVGEYIASTKGVGYLALYALRTYDNLTMFSAISVLVLGGYLLFGLLSYLEWKMVFWRPHEEL